jgi:tetratricopeptide (TPR) repeat protein/tRNA A-37 threonylcarbamoyl transferase component Bud32
MHLPPGAATSRLSPRRHDSEKTSPVPLGQPSNEEEIQRLRASIRKLADDIAPMPRVVGDYRLLGEIGRGGMGMVYEAEQLSLGRRVALKILPLQAAWDEQALERFQREARSVARLHHTNIVPVFEVGRDGETCYYAMQLIQGENLEHVIDRLRQPSDEPFACPIPANESERFRMVAQVGQQVAQALAYAHARGVVHRDIKPSNLLVDASGTPWITDFGLAKVEDDNLSRTGDLFGTLRYMAPERFEGKGDARADIYALGLTLYELLLLRPAYDTSDHLQMLLMLRSEEPPRPRRVLASIPRDLETIVLKAMEKDPERRYPTADAMAEDLRRFLADEPIAARPVGVLENVWRSARRNPRLALLTSLVLVLLVALVGGSVVAAVLYQDMAAQERVQAEQARAARDEATTESRRAQEESAASREIAEFMLGMLEEADPLAFTGRGFGSRKLGVSSTPFTSFDSATEKLKVSFHDRPVVRAALLDKMGAVHISMGHFVKAKPMLDEALEIRLRQQPPSIPELADTWQHLGYYHHVQLQHARSEHAYRQALKLRLDHFGPQSTPVAESKAHLGFLLSVDHDNDEAEKLLKEATDTIRKECGADSREYGIVVAGNLLLHFRRNEFIKALPYLAEAKTILEKLDGRDVVAKTVNLYLQAQVTKHTGSKPQALAQFRETLRIGQDCLGEHHFFVYYCRKQIAQILAEELNEHAAAEREFKEVAKYAETSFGGDSSEYADCRMMIGTMMLRRNRSAEAEEELREAVKLMRAHPSSDVPMCLLRHGRALVALGRHEEAEPIFAEATELRRRSPSRSRYWLGITANNWLNTLETLGRYDRMVEVLRQLLPEIDQAATMDGRDHYLQACRRMWLHNRLGNDPSATEERDRLCEEAMGSLRRAAQARHRFTNEIRTPIFAPLRDRHEFQEYLKRLAKAS